MKSNQNLLEEFLEGLNQHSHISPDLIPNIDLYMDQLISFMDSHLQKTKRYPDDKALTKTMINNYAKNNLLPPPVKKRYSKDHIMMLLFIYYYKSILSFRDIETLFDPIIHRHFQTEDPIQFETIYEAAFSVDENQIQALKADIRTKFKHSETTFSDADKESRSYLQLFSLISELALDVYVKTRMIEYLIDQMREDSSPASKKKK